jgi:hypothetical protein
MIWKKAAAGDNSEGREGLQLEVLTFCSAGGLNAKKAK